MWEVGHEANRTKGEIFWALSLLTPFNHLLCPYMKLSIHSLSAHSQIMRSDLVTSDLRTVSV